MFTLSYWLVFLAAAVAISISPGPDLIYIITRVVSYGKKYGFLSSLGVASGALFHIALVAFGLAAIFAASQLAFTIVKIAGAVYLLYLGVRAIFFSSKNSVSFNDISKKPVSGWAVYKQGILVDILNPKAAIFFMAFLPQFTRPGMGPFALQIILLGIAVLIVGMIVEGCIILAASKAASILVRKKAVAVWLDRVMGSVLIGLGISLVCSSYRE
ncbi:MAG TPA: LysE family translocator [Firmicutes bacterium]|jgi:threonine/homoserine/homoserine lactone efflux protein|nr:LysE family translocator [Bacillota bacterium]